MKAVQVPADDSWIIDSGASRHMTSRKDWYTSLQSIENDILVAVGNDAKCPTKGKGTIALKSNGVVKQLYDVLYVQDIRRYLLSISTIMDRDLKVHFDKNGTEILDPRGKVVEKGSRCNNVYELFSARANVSTSKL